MSSAIPPDAQFRGRVGGSGSSRGARRWPLVAAAWIGLLAAIIAGGLLGRASPPSDPAVVPREVGPAVAGRPTVVASSNGPLAAERLDMTLPATRNVLIMTRAVEVAGTLEGTAGEVVVTLESRGSHQLESRTVAVVDGRFRTTFELPNPRPGGRMFVSVVLLAPDGTPLEAIRRPIVSGPLARRTLGEDGLVGGIVFGGATLGRGGPG